MAHGYRDRSSACEGLELVANYLMISKTATDGCIELLAPSVHDHKQILRLIIATIFEEIVQEHMSALGQKATCAPQNVMSALPPKADMCGATTDVR